MKFSLILGSENRKTGPIPQTYSSRNTCPDCPLKGSCYAESGFSRWHWNRVDRAGLTFDNFTKQLKSLPKGQLIRLSVAGDLPGKNNKLDENKINKLIEVLKDKKAYGYTHYPVSNKHKKDKKHKISRKTLNHNKRLIKKLNDNGITINLSANNVKEADTLKKLNIAPVVSILSKNSPEKVFTKEGNKIIVCPAVTKKDVTCATCALCQKNRGVIIGFPAHSVNANKIEKIVENL